MERTTFSLPQIEALASAIDAAGTDLHQARADPHLEAFAQAIPVPAIVTASEQANTQVHARHTRLCAEIRAFAAQLRFAAEHYGANEGEAERAFMNIFTGITIPDPSTAPVHAQHH